MGSATSVPKVQINDAEIVERAQKGDNAAFAELYDLYKQRAYRICFRLLGNKNDTEDVVQDVFVRLIEKIELFRGDSQFSTWFHVLVRNLALMKLRKKSGELVFSMDELADPDGPFHLQFAEDDPHQAFLPERLDIKNALESLSPKNREALHQHDVEGLNFSEMSALLGANVNVLKSRVRRARRVMRSLL